MDPRLDENEAELGVLVFAVTLEMLSDRDGLEITVSAIYLYIYLGRKMGGGGRGRQTFLINMYRSSGISGARPGGGQKRSLRQSKTKQRQNRSERE